MVSVWTLLAHWVSSIKGSLTQVFSVKHMCDVVCGMWIIGTLHTATIA